MQYYELATKEELLELLKKYRGILNASMLSYLRSLIELEFSVIKEYISKTDQKALAELEIYKEVAIYNIFKRTQNLFNNQNGEFSLYAHNIDSIRLSVSKYLNEENSHIDLFEFKSYNGNLDNRIGDVSLFQTLENKELKQAELNRVMNKLERLYNQRNPYASCRGLIGGPGADWEYDHAKEIGKYEAKFNELDGKELSENDKLEIELTSQIHELLLDEFGLTNESFKEKNNISLLEEKSCLNKKLVKRMPNFTITDNIKYI